MDNSRYLFEWCLANLPEVEAVWMTRSRQVYERLKSDGRPVVRYNSLRGILLLLRARAGVISNQILDIAPAHWALPRRVGLVVLGHGQPVKGYRFTRRQGIPDRFAGAIRDIADRAVVAVSTSEFMADVDSASQAIARNKYAISGFPRNDRLLDVSREMEESWRRFVGEDSRRHTILYAPTWRREYSTKFFPFQDFSADLLIDFLRHLDALLLLRPHVQDMRKEPLASFLRMLQRPGSGIKLMSNDQVPDVNDVLPFVDVLVTDYSSIYHDFLLLDRPMIFVPYDYERFDQEDGFVYDYFENLPGPTACDFAAFCRHLSSACLDPTEFSGRRSELGRRIHEHQDARACERVGTIIRNNIATRTPWDRRAEALDRVSE